MERSRKKRECGVWTSDMVDDDVYVVCGGSRDLVEISRSKIRILKEDLSTEDLRLRLHLLVGPSLWRQPHKYLASRRGVKAWRSEKKVW